MAVLRGRVIDRDDDPVSGVLITILAHSEFGETRTRADGLFDLVVNGGSALVVRYFRPDRAYIREMQAYGILPAGLKPQDPVDPYAADREYWRSLWYRPVTAARAGGGG